MRKTGYILLTALPFLVVATALLSLSAGEMSIPFGEIPHYLNDPLSTEYSVLTYIRIPRTLLAIAIGGSLSLSGVILQGIYRNPLIEPYTLGISGGASLGITLAIVAGLVSLGYLVLPIAGFAGAFISIFLVYSLSLRRGTVNINRMLLIGVMTSFVCSSLIMFLMSITTTDNLHGIVFWTMGSLNESNPYLIKLLVIMSALMLILSYLFVVPLNALRAGETKAKHLGLNTHRTIRLLFLLTSVLTGCCIAVGGIIGFVGLIIPHITRTWAGNNYRQLLIASFLTGSIFLLLCDILARTIIAPNELPIGVITGMVGGVVFIAILNKKHVTN